VRTLAGFLHELQATESDVQWVPQIVARNRRDLFEACFLALELFARGAAFRDIGN
jgi:hypothetical protein